MEPKIIRKNSFQLVGYHFFTNLQEVGEEHFTENMVARLAQMAEGITNRIGEHINIVQVYPLMEEFNPFEDNFHIVIGFEVEKADEIPPGTTTYTVDGNMYVNLKHQGDQSDIYKTYDFLYNRWIDKNRYTPLGIEMEVWDNMENKTDVFIAINKQN